MITSLIKTVLSSGSPAGKSSDGRSNRSVLSLTGATHLLLTAGFLTITLATTNAFAQKTPSTPAPTVPGAPVPAPTTDDLSPKTPSTPAPSAAPGQPATGTTVATPAKGSTVATPATETPAASPTPTTSATGATPSAVPTPATPAAPATAEGKGPDQPAEGQEGTPAATETAPKAETAKPVDPDASAAQQATTTAPLNTVSELPIAPNPTVDFIFNLFNIVSIGALICAVITGTLWYIRHKKRVALGLDDDDEDDDDDDDEIVPAKVSVVDEPKMIESKNALPMKESETVTETTEVVGATAIETTSVSTSTVKDEVKASATSDTTSDGVDEPPFPSIPSSTSLLTDSADPATILSGNRNDTSSSGSGESSAGTEKTGTENTGTENTGTGNTGTGNTGTGNTASKSGSKKKSRKKKN